MRCLAPTAFARLLARRLARLTPPKLRTLERMVSEARERVDAVFEIDARAEMPVPRCACRDAHAETGMPRRAARRPRASAAVARAASGGAGPGPGSSDGAARAAMRPGRAAAAHRARGCIVPTSWSRSRAT